MIWWDHIRASAYMPIPGGLDAIGETSELKLRLKFSWTWCFSFNSLWFYLFDFGFFVCSFVFSCWFLCCLFGCFILVGFLFLISFLLSFFFFLYYQFYHQHLLILTLNPSLSLLLLCWNPLFPSPGTHFSTSHTTLPPVLTLASHSPPTCHQTNPVSYTFITWWLTYYNNFTQPQTSAIPTTSTLYYNNRNTPKHTQGPQNPTAPALLPSLTTPLLTSPFSATLYNSPNFYS
jgi:hypothetical protein